jgi:hypothetical protein
MCLHLQDEAPRLWKDMSHPASPRRPYWDILPANGSVLSYYNMPLQYLPLVQHAATVSWRSARAAVQQAQQQSVLTATTYCCTTTHLCSMQPRELGVAWTCSAAVAAAGGATLLINMPLQHLLLVQHAIAASWWSAS